MDSIRSAWGVPRYLPITLGQRIRTDLPIGCSLPAWRASRPRTYPPASPHRSNKDERYWNLNQLSITYAFRPRLRPASPAVDQHGCGTLGHSVGKILTLLALLMPTFALPPLQVRFRSPFTAGRDAPLPLRLHGIRGFGARLEPRWIVGAATPSTSELLRTL